MACRSCGFLIALLLVPALVWAQEPRLDLDAVDRPLSEILNDITARTGVVFDPVADLDERVTLRLENEPLSSALRKLLADHDYLMLYEGSAGSRRLSRVRILARRAVPPESAEVAGARTPPWGRASPGRASPERTKQLVLRRTGDNPFVARGRINGLPVELLIDTGATTVALSSELAHRLGLVRGTSQQVSTASGTTIGYSTVLRQLTLGDLQLSNVRAIILPAMRSGQRVLLGMNVLAEFELIQRGDVLVLRQSGR